MIAQTVDMEIVSEILSHPDIWPNIAPPGVEPFAMPYLPGVTYFLVNHTDGLIAFHQFRDGVKIHPNILPEKRGKLAYDAVEESIQVMFSQYRNIYAEISKELVHVIRFAKALKFKTIETGDRIIMIRRRLDS